LHVSVFSIPIGVTNAYSALIVFGSIAHVIRASDLWRLAPEGGQARGQIGILCQSDFCPLRRRDQVIGAGSEVK